MRHNLRVVRPVGFDDIPLWVCELSLEVVVNCVEDVRYPDRVSLSHGDWFPIPPCSGLVDEMKVDAQRIRWRVRGWFTCTPEKFYVVLHMPHHLYRVGDVPLDRRFARQKAI